jgi:dTDP-4-dehydrorhamnose 3,5-epimerase and related enzymes
MLIQGNSYTDERGTLRFINDFHFDGIKRFYTISHPGTSMIRAWQGHKIETKYFFVTKGEFLICWVEIDNWENPGKELKVNKQILSANDPQMLIIPAGNANGFKALETDSQLIVFSDLTLEEAKNDDYRFERDYWTI